MVSEGRGGVLGRNDGDTATLRLPDTDSPRAQVLFLWASEEINRFPDEYWTLVMDVARRSTLARVRRCSQIMGREESDDLSAAQVFYPCMQCADVFYLKARPA